MHMTQLHLSPEAELFLSPQQTNEHGLMLVQQLAELIPDAEDVDVTTEPINVAGTLFQCVVIVLRKTDKRDVTCIIQQADVTCRHPQTHEPMFRGERLIKEVIIPMVEESWNGNAY